MRIQHLTIMASVLALVGFLLYTWGPLLLLLLSGRRFQA